MDKVKVLFVCLGNICRSPLAEGIFKHKIQQKGLSDKFEADSCGTSNYHIGDQPDSRTVENAVRNGVPLDHCCRQIRPDDLEKFDYIFVMDANNLKTVLRLPNAHQNAGKIQLMREFDPVESGEVPDPYFGNEEGFQHVFDILDRTLENFINHVQTTRVGS